VLAFVPVPRVRRSHRQAWGSRSPGTPSDVRGAGASGEPRTTSTVRAQRLGAPGWRVGLPVRIAQRQRGAPRRRCVWRRRRMGSSAVDVTTGDVRATRAQCSSHLQKGFLKCRRF
jgi:hypothetical protein